jgi:hypothetical protein
MLWGLAQRWGDVPEGLLSALGVMSLCAPFVLALRPWV